MFKLYTSVTVIIIIIIIIGSSSGVLWKLIKAEDNLIVLTCLLDARRNLISLSVPG